MSFTPSINVGYGFIVDDTPENRKKIYDLQGQNAQNQVEFSPDLWLDEFLLYDVFPDLFIKAYRSEGNPEHRIVVLVRQSRISLNDALDPVTPVKLTYPSDDSWDAGEQQLTLLGVELGLPVENTAQDPDAYSWVFYNEVF